MKTSKRAKRAFFLLLLFTTVKSGRKDRKVQIARCSYLLRKPCYRKKNARCTSCSLQFKPTFTTNLRVAKLWKPGFRAVESVVKVRGRGGMCLLLENVVGCVHAGRPEVVILNICYNWPVLFRATHILQENVGEHMPVAYWKDTISGFMFP